MEHTGFWPQRPGFKPKEGGWLVAWGHIPGPSASVSPRRGCGDPPTGMDWDEDQVWSQPTAWCPWHVSTAECMPGWEGPQIGLGDTGPQVSASGDSQFTGDRQVHQHWQCHMLRPTPGVFAQVEGWAGHREVSAQSRFWISAQPSPAPTAPAGITQVKWPQETCYLRKHWGSTPHLGVTLEPPAVSRLPCTHVSWKLKRHLW